MHGTLWVNKCFCHKYSEMKLDGSVLNCKIVIEGYDFIRLDRCRKGGVFCFTHSIAYRYKVNICRKRDNMYFYRDICTKIKTIYCRYPI